LVYGFEVLVYGFEAVGICVKVFLPEQKQKEVRSPPEELHNDEDHPDSPNNVKIFSYEQWMVPRDF
jgi:hypothetical protein